MTTALAHVAVRSPAAAVPRADSRWARPAHLAGVTGCVILVCGGTWLALAAASNDWLVDSSSAPEPHWALGPLSGIMPALTDPTTSVLYLVMLAGWLLALPALAQLPSRALIAIAVWLTALFTLTSPILSSDIFGYVAYAHLGVLAGLNPYTHGAQAAPHDPLLALVYWRAQPSPYGPLFTLITYPLSHLSVAAATWSLKALAGVGGLAAILFTALTARRLGREPGAAVFLISANPLLVAYGFGGGHNDLIVAGLAAGAAYLIVRGHGAGAGAALATTVAVKATGGLLALFVLAGFPEHRRRLLIGLAIGGAVLGAATLIAFGPHLPTSASVATSPEFVASWSGPDALGRLLGTGATAGVRFGLLGFAAIVTAVSLVLVTRRTIAWATGATFATLAMLVAVVSLVPWYLAWLLPAAALAPGRAPRMAIAVLTAAMTFTRLPVLGFALY